MHLEEVIGNLLFKHSCVVVPDFGGFIAKKSSARIDYSSGIMYAPVKSVLFNAQLHNNDGLLISEFAKKNDIAYTESLQEISLKVKSWKNTLANGERISLDKVGYLYLDKQQNLRFEQDRFFNLLMESYGLGKVHFVSEKDAEIFEEKEEFATIVEASPVLNHKPKTVQFIPAEISHSEEKLETEPKEILVNFPKRKNKLLKYIAAAAIIPFAFYAYWLPMETQVLQSGMLSFKDLNPFVHTAKSEYTPTIIKVKHNSKETAKTWEEQQANIPENISTYMYQYDADLALPVKLNKTQPVNNLEVEPEVGAKVEREANLVDITPITQNNNQTATTDSKSKYNFIVGCFGSKTNAENLLKSLKDSGFNAQIVDQKGGLYRVSAGGANDELSLQKIIQDAESKNYKGWILTK